VLRNTPACGGILFVAKHGRRIIVPLIALFVENVMIGANGTVESVTAVLMGSPNLAAVVEGYPIRTMIK
jgi:hypothetical protein